jgi:hypothetical protein
MPESAVPAFPPERIPLGAHAIVPRDKVRHYLLNPGHPIGRHKAKLWQETFGVTRDHAEELRSAIARMAAEGAVVDCRDALDGPPGVTWTVECLYTGPNGRTSLVRSNWDVRRPGTVPRLATAWPQPD